APSGHLPRLPADLLQLALQAFELAILADRPVGRPLGRLRFTLLRALEDRVLAEDPTADAVAVDVAAHVAELRPPRPQGLGLLGLDVDDPSEAREDVLGHPVLDVGAQRREAGLVVARL